MLSILETELHSIHILSSRSGLTLHTALYLKTQIFLDTISEADFCIARLRHSGMRILFVTQRNSRTYEAHPRTPQTWICTIHTSLEARKFLTWAEIGAR